MDRYLVAYLLVAGLVVALAAVVVRARYHSRSHVLRRSRHADEARWAERERLRAEGATSED